jgi:DNA repair protein RadC
MLEMIADMPVEDRPRERLARYGARMLTDRDLIAILLGSGTRDNSAIAVAFSMLTGGLTELAKHDVAQLSKTAGVGLAKASRILAAFELGRRYAIAGDGNPTVYEYRKFGRDTMIRTRSYTQEHVGALFLDSRNRILGEREIFVGTLDRAIVSTREVIKYALEANAVGVVLYHNHPSGDATPSPDDHEFTQRMDEALKLVNMRLVDHLITGSKVFTSMKGPLGN